MSTFETVLGIVLLILLLGFVWVVTELNAVKKELAQKPENDPETLKLRLQAYERITLLTERISLQNLLSRVNNAGLSCRQMQISLIDSIKQEYD
jgi:hypothetical protein